MSTTEIEQLKARLAEHEQRVERNRKKWRESRKSYYKEKKEELLAYQKQWYERNREQILARRREKYNRQQLEKLLAREVPANP